MAFILMSQTLVSVSKKIVQEWRNLPMWTSDRSIKAPRMEDLRRKIEEGVFHGPEWAMAVWEDR